ncbi:hypothetical protein MON38_09050 [Hymenobacter sp. DH14]|uniref:Uncharacterized protein n=1 Tax=Hymenobacter cyanobacteriorum TaxID=2926463 RepID=A0A9X1VIF7_9BACT|nr:hypothetical protein [Hymenobacter cyanobacteriorum]MCI1187565.1 hypothetical protein [Hymenobacter cyanobacteriorum]
MKPLLLTSLGLLLGTSAFAQHTHMPGMDMSMPPAKPAPAKPKPAAPAPRPKPKPKPVAPAIRPNAARPTPAPRPKPAAAIADTTRTAPAPAMPGMDMPGMNRPAPTAAPAPPAQPTPAMPDHNMPGHDMPGMNMGTNAGTAMPGMAPADSSGMMMTHLRNSFSKSLPMARQGSGTSWHPDSSPMYMQMYQTNGWDVMLMYSVFLRYTRQNFNHDNLRGDANFRANSYVMGMANHLVGQRGLFSIQAMVTADPLTVGGAGYPLLFQTGESWKGEKLHDHQHPHDLLSALAVAYTHAASDNVDLTAYLGYPGEPAIGPPVFMHRPSAANLPSAPLGHHWQDATHIQFGVATLGVRYRNAKLEGSLFTGREPNENRYSFDRPRFDSYSARLSVNPSDNLALQVSAAHLKSPEELEPNDNVDRTSASVLHNANVGRESILSTTAVWGMNRHSGLGEETTYSNSFLLESNLQARSFNLFTRLETLQLNYDELLLPAATDHDAHANRQVSAFTLGASKYLAKTNAGWLDLGLTGTLNTYNTDNTTLLAAYGRNPLSFEVYLRFIAPRMSMHMGHGGMKHGGMKGMKM